MTALKVVAASELRCGDLVHLNGGIWYIEAAGVQCTPYVSAPADLVPHVLVQTSGGAFLVPSSLRVAVDSETSQCESLSFPDAALGRTTAETKPEVSLTVTVSVRPHGATIARTRAASLRAEAEPDVLGLLQSLALDGAQELADDVRDDLELLKAAG